MLAILAIALLLIVFGLRLFAAIPGNSVTYDESVHVTRGFAALRLHDLRLNVEHPVLGDALAAIPLAFDPTIQFPEESIAWQTASHWVTAQLFLWHTNQRPQAMVEAARGSVAIMTILLACVVFVWSMELYGWRWALLSLLLCTLCPNILANGTLATNDLSLTLFTVMYLWLLWRFVHRPGILAGACCALVLAAAMMCKYSGLLLLADTALLLLWVWWRACRTDSSAPPAEDSPSATAPEETEASLQGSKSAGSVRHATARSSLLIPLAYFSGITVVAAIVVWAAYGFRLGTILTPVVETQEVGVDLDQFVRRSQPHPDERLINQPGDILKAPPPLPHNLRLKLLTRISVPAPQYFRGLIQNYMQAKGGHRSFLMGRVSRTGWWYYFIVAFLVKTPIPFLLLIGCALASAAVWREWDEWFILVPCAILVLMAMKAHIDIGIRHLLPIYPLMAIFCGRLGGLFERIRSGKEPRTLPVAVTSLAILVVWFAVDSAVVHPRYLTYFNEIAGGPKGGSRFLVDSNLDWGQDLMRLETALRKHNPPIQSIALAYFGTAEPGAYRIDSIPLDTDPSNVPLNMKPPVAGWVAASVSDLAYFGRPGGSLYWLSHYRPEFIVGNTIRVYHILAPGVKRSDTTRIPPLAPMHWP